MGRIDGSGCQLIELRTPRTPVAGNAQVRFEQLARCGAQPEIDMGNDAGANLHRAVVARGAHRGDPVHELRFSEGHQLGRPVAAEH